MQEFNKTKKKAEKPKWIISNIYPLCFYPVEYQSKVQGLLTEQAVY